MGATRNSDPIDELTGSVARLIRTGSQCSDPQLVRLSAVQIDLGKTNCPDAHSSEIQLLLETIDNGEGSHTPDRGLPLNARAINSAVFNRSNAAGEKCGLSNMPRMQKREVMSMGPMIG